MFFLCTFPFCRRPELGQVNENNTSNQLLVSNMLANQNFNEINAQSCSYPPFFQQNPVNVSILIYLFHYYGCSTWTMFCKPKLTLLLLLIITHKQAQAGAWSWTTNGHFMTNQTSPAFALNNRGINPPSAWNYPR